MGNNTSTPSENSDIPSPGIIDNKITYQMIQEDTPKSV